MNQSAVNDAPTSEATPPSETRLLLSRHLDGDLQAFPELIAGFQRQVYSYLVRNGVPDSARDDLFQDIFLKVHKAASSYRPERPFEPWLFTIVANTTRSYFRKQVIRQRLQNQLPLHMPVGVDAQDSAQNLETAEWLEGQIQRLPAKQREVLALCCFDNLSGNEVAQILDCPLATVKTHLRRARLSLAKALTVRDRDINGGKAL